jgi:hypothetical protein
MKSFLHTRHAAACAVTVGSCLCLLLAVLTWCLNCWLQLLLTEHNRMKETRERREAEKKEREEKRMAELKCVQFYTDHTMHMLQLRPCLHKLYAHAVIVGWVVCDRRLPSAAACLLARCWMLLAVVACLSCRALKEAERKTPGFQRLRMAQYDDLRKKLISSHGTRALKGEVRCCWWCSCKTMGENNKERRSCVCTCAHVPEELS